MQLLIDSDVFAKLGVSGLLVPLLEVLDVTLDDCGRLPALPYMLRRGGLPRLYGQEACDALQEIANAIGLAPQASPLWLQRLTTVPQVDAGEAQLLASAAEYSLLFITGDKRALVAIARIADFAEALAGRIITVEGALLFLCIRLGDDAVRVALGPLLSKDRALRICFSQGNAEPRAALVSYFECLQREVAPLVLWNPREEEGT